MKGEVMSQPEIRFYIELPVDEEGNTAYGFAVFAGYVEDGRLAEDHRPGRVQAHGQPRPLQRVRRGARAGADADRGGIRRDHRRAAGPVTRSGQPGGGIR